MTEEAFIKQKVDEAAKEAWNIIGKKAAEAGIKNGTKSLWLFFNRVNSFHFSVLNNARLQVQAETFGQQMTTDEPTPQAEKE